MRFERVILLFIVGNVIIHHGDNVFRWDPMVAHDVVCMANVSLVAKMWHKSVS